MKRVGLSLSYFFLASTFALELKSNFLKLKPCLENNANSYTYKCTFLCRTCKNMKIAAKVPTLRSYTRKQHTALYQH
jgi:nitrate reductase assembly molybdenum cofactor insertion protein NarJ